MRGAWPVLLFIPLLAVAGAQDAPMGEDDANDVTFTGGGPVTPGVKEIDLRSLDVREDSEHIFVTLGVESIGADAETDMLATAYEVTFAHNDQQFMAYASRNNVFGAGQFHGHVAVHDPGFDRFVPVDEVPFEVDFAENLLTWSLPRELLRDTDGAAPFPGRELSEFVATSFANRITDQKMKANNEEVPQPQATDRMPDDGVLEQVYAITEGVASSGHIRLMSEEPFRASNGAATTFIIHVTAINNGDTQDRVRFEATQGPAQWEVTLPDDLILEADAEQRVPIVIRTAFAHNHGGTEAITISAHSSNDPSSVGRVEVGIHYPAIPQPAGHHDVLWLHTVDHSDDPFYLAFATALGLTFGATGVLQDEYMNTLEEDDNADDVPAEGYKCNIELMDPDYPIGTTHCWTFPLNPGLLMGLDFDTQRTGSLEFVLESLAAMPQTRVEGSLIYAAPSDNPDIPDDFLFARDTTELATIGRSDFVDLTTGGKHTFELEVTPTAEADLIPYVKGAGLFLELRSTTLRPDTFAFGPSLPPPTVHAGGRLQLPLNEYADPVADLFISAGGLSLTPVGEQERIINAGKTIIFKAELQNDGNDTEVELDIVGSNREWAEILAEESLLVYGRETRTIAVAVTAPDGATDGEMADLVLQVSSLSDVNDRSLVRFLATVDNSVDVPDESVLEASLYQSDDKQSPGFMLPLLLMALVAIVGRKRLA